MIICGECQHERHAEAYCLAPSDSLLSCGCEPDLGVRGQVPWKRRAPVHYPGDFGHVKRCPECRLTAGEDTP